MQPVETVPLHEATSERYLHYALSVITSRALPDVRDGLKPVQRRILYTLFHELNLKPDGRYRKTAAVVGEVMGKYHPHGDQAIYDALVRMAQPFSLRVPLVDGQGNFGSLDGDPPAAMRYTECRLAPLALELLDELGRRTVDYRPTYDGQRFEPIVLPAQLPHLLLNGSEGIAVGMATRIPPHHPGELIDATIAVLRDPQVSLDQLLTVLRGPDFPTGGALLATAADLREIYGHGQGTVRVQATWREEKDGRKRLLVVDSVPYGQNKARILEAIGDHVLNRRLPLVQDVRDESTEDVRIVLELKADASAEAVMAWLFKHTSLQVSWPVNLTALVPGDRPDVATPARLDLRALLQHWLDFRVATLRRRYQHDLDELERRIHVLEGFALVFDALDEIIALIRASEGRRDAHERLMARFGLTDEQTEAILELRLYRLARLEIHLIREELGEKRNQAAQIRQLLASEAALRGRLESELRALREVYNSPRRTRLGASELSYEEDRYIVAEDAFLVVTRDAWFKRQSSFTDLSRIRVREGDEVAWVLRASTRSTVTFFGSQGGAWTLRLDDVPATAGHGEPLARHLALADGERVVGVVSHDPRHLPASPEGAEDAGPTLLVLTQGGRGLRFPLAPLAEPSTRAGRRVARLDEGDAVFGVWLCRGEAWLCLATTGGRAVAFAVNEVPEVKAAGKGVAAIKVEGDGDSLLAAELHHEPTAGPKVQTAQGREVVVSPNAYGGPRGGGKVVVKRGGLSGWTRGVALVGLDGGAGQPPAQGG